MQREDKVVFAVIASGIQTICKTMRQVDTIVALYPYPKFKKVRDEVEARVWLRENTRKMNCLTFSKYGSTATAGYARIEYFISNNEIFYNIDTRKVGYIKVLASEEVSVDARATILKVKVRNVCLDNSMIAHHIIAIKRILKILGEYIDVDITVPDVSIFLALTRYTGNNYLIKGIQRDIEVRLGAVSITVKD